MFLSSPTGYLCSIHSLYVGFHLARVTKTHLFHVCLRRNTMEMNGISFAALKALKNERVSPETMSALPMDNPPNMLSTVFIAHYSSGEDGFIVDARG